MSLTTEETRFINFEKRTLLNENLDDCLLLRYALVFKNTIDREEFINRYRKATRDEIIKEERKKGNQNYDYYQTKL